MDQVPSVLDASPTALRTAGEESELAELISIGRAAQGRIDAGDGRHRCDLLDAIDAGRAATWRFVTANQRLVASIARSVGAGLEFNDRLQAGTLGLLRAAEKFDVSHGTKFSTYATWWIRQAIQRAAADESRIVRLPVHFHETARPVRAAQYRLRETLDCEPTTAQIAEACGKDEETVKEVLQLDREQLSLDEAVAEIDTDIARTAVRTDVEVEDAADARALCAEVLALLTEREAEVVKRRCGFDTGEPETLDQIGKSLGVTRERIRQIEAKAREKVLTQFESVA